MYNKNTIWEVSLDYVNSKWQIAYKHVGYYKGDAESVLRLVAYSSTCDSGTTIIMKPITVTSVEMIGINATTRHAYGSVNVLIDAEDVKPEELFKDTYMADCAIEKNGNRSVVAVLNQEKHDAEIRERVLKRLNAEELRVLGITNITKE